jgi:hypothetical protein
MSEQPTGAAEANLVSGIDSVEINSVQIDPVPILFVGIKNEDLFNENQVLAEKLVEERLVKLTEKYNWDDETIKVNAALMLDHIEMLKKEASLSKELENQESITTRLRDYWDSSKALVATQVTMLGFKISEKFAEREYPNNPNIIKNRKVRAAVAVGFVAVGAFVAWRVLDNINSLSAESAQALGDTSNILDLNNIPNPTNGSEDTLNSLDLNMPDLEEAPTVDDGALTPDSPLSPTDSNNIDTSGNDSGYGSDTNTSGPDGSYGSTESGGNDTANQGTDTQNTNPDNSSQLTNNQKRLLDAKGQYPFGRFESVYGKANAGDEIFKAVDECLKKGIKVIEHGSRENPNLATDPWWLEVPNPNGSMSSTTNRVMEVLVTKSV